MTSSEQLFQIPFCSAIFETLWGMRLSSEPDLIYMEKLT